MYHVCTIGSGAYRPFVETLFRSLCKQEDKVMLHALITDGPLPQSDDERLKYYSLGTIAQEPYMERIIHQYDHRNDYLRWSLKPVFLLYLSKLVGKVIYVDNDIYFFNSFGFLFDQLEHHSLLLTPHWCSFDPWPHEENFKTNYQIGLFNAGFIGASENSVEILSWWARACLYRMERNEKEGLFDDQRYLDMAMIIDPAVGIVRHLGCNVGSWNMHQNKRTRAGDQVLIGGTYPVVFIHFNKETIKHIVNGNDALLRPYYDEYERIFALTGQHLPSIKHDFENGSFLIDIKRKLRIRTRVKQAIFRLYQKL